MDYAALDDNSLIRLLAYKKTDALSALYDRYGKLVFSLAFAVVNDQGAAEEITQDVFVRVWENAGVYDEARASFRSWITRIARNRAIDVFRQRRGRPEQHAVDWTDPAIKDLTNGNSPARTVELRLQQERVRAAIAQLPDEQGRALKLAYLQGYTHHEIAQHLKEPLGTVKTRIRLGMQKLRTLLKNERSEQSKTGNLA